MEMIVLAVIVIAVIGIVIWKKKDGDDGDSDNGSGGGSTNDGMYDSHASFLMVKTPNAPHARAMNYLSNHFSDAQRDDFRHVMHTNGDNAMYCYLADQGDGPMINPYKENFGGSWGNTLNMANINHWKWLMRQAKEEGLNTIAWLFADDSPQLSNTSLAQKLKYVNDMIDNFEMEVVGWVIALEADEHIDKNHYVEMIKLLQQRSQHPIGTHLIPKGDQRPDMAYYLAGVDYYFVQVGFAQETLGHSEERHVQYVGDETRRLVAKFPDHKIIMAEYNLDSSSQWAKKQGQMAMASGAVGTGNGW